MNKQDRLEANMACAELLGMYYKVCDLGDTLFVPVTFLGINSTSEFDIFTNAEQCLEVVKKLGSDYDVDISWKERFNAWQPVTSHRVLSEPLAIYEQAVAAAAMEVVKDE